MPNPPSLQSDEAQSASADLDPDPELPRLSQRLTVDIVHDCDGWKVISALEPLIQTAADAVQAQLDLGTSHTTVAVMLTSDAEARRLNAQWRGIDKATNVLSFPAPEAPGDLEVVAFLGDIALACETVLAEAVEQNTTPGHHLQHLVVHGLLHLLGYDHETSDDAAEMEALEVEILARLGIVDPYEGLELVSQNSGEVSA